ncbi:prepilin-type N-terminal cleavage/methylation domain-containing protein [Parapusillimonas sp. SGNA-6]|nr:prepilin-type N-terminal cleavage/methylation domain-containing protein [Parapusillimonas sp. SGNA-6]
MAAATQRGFALLELAVAMLLATLLAVWGASLMANRIADASAQANAAWMLSVKGAVRAYLARYGPALALADHAGVLGGYADWSAPTLTELKADGMLSVGFPMRIAPGGGAAIRLLRHGGCPGPDCLVDVLIHSETPFVHQGTSRPDEQLIAQWMIAVQGWGGWVSAAQPGVLRGPSYQFPNPPAAGPPLAPGTVALAVLAGQDGGFEYLRVRDTRNPDFQGSATIKGDVVAGADLRVGRYLYVEAIEMFATPCDLPGAVARERDGGLLICRDQRWSTASRTGGGGFSTNAVHGCRNAEGYPTFNPLTDACSCPGMSAMVQISDSGPNPSEGRTTGYLCVD